MIFHVQKCFKSFRFLCSTSKSCSLFHTSPENCSSALSSILSSPLGLSQFEDSTRLSDLDIIIAKVSVGSSDDEVLQSLAQDQACNSIQLTDKLVDQLFHRFKNDWKSALGVFRWVESRSDYKLTPDVYDLIVDILGKMKQMDKITGLLEKMRQDHLVTLNTVGKVMRRFAGAGKWEDSVRIFDDLGSFGLEKNTESMNLLLDTLCKENKVEKAREIFLELKSHISPNANTFNIFIHGWCKIKRVDEAHWTIQEMKGHGNRPCVISYSTIVLFYCHQYNFGKVYELFDEMEAQGCPPNVVTYTSVMCFLAKSEEFEEALLLYERMKSAGCDPDTLFYNSLIHTLGRAGRVREAQLKKKKDYYEILGVERSCTGEDVRKAYRKLSLKVHPDKNKAPGAEEAFKSVSKAFQCLSNQESRKKYDVMGSDEPVYERRATKHGAHGFNGFNGFYDADVDAEEIFRNFFFGGGGMAPATQFRGFSFGHNGMGQRGGDHGSGGSNIRILIQLLPVLLILLVSFMPSSEPIYALSRSYPYEYRFTTEKGVNFYVKSTKFEQEFPPGTSERVNLEHRVERDYFNILSQNCRLEMQRRQWGFIRETPHCDMLQRFEFAA